MFLSISDDSNRSKTSNWKSTAEATTGVATKKCYFCGLEMPKNLLGQHNFDVHSVLRFDWVGGKPKIVYTNTSDALIKNTVEELVPNVQFPPATHVAMAAPPIGQIYPVLAPPLPNCPIPVPIIPKPPSDSVEKKSHESEKSSKKPLVTRLANTSDNNLYDMDISAESDSESDHLVEGSLFDNYIGKQPIAQAKENDTETNVDANACTLRKISPEKLPEVNSTAAENAGVAQSNKLDGEKIVIVPKNVAKPDGEQVKQIDKAKYIAKPAKSKLSRPKLSAEVNDNFFELILTARVFSDCNEEYADWPVRSKLKHENTETNEHPQKRQRQTSSSSTVSGNGKTQQRRITTADLKKLIETKKSKANDN